jgi:hypothetical protein
VPIGGVITYSDADEILAPLLSHELWGVPIKFDQGCFDAFQLIDRQQLVTIGKARRKKWRVRIVQVTIAAKHDLKTRFIGELLKVLNKKLGSRHPRGIITELEVVILLPRKRLAAFASAPVDICDEVLECSPWKEHWGKGVGLRRSSTLPFLLSESWTDAQG